MLRIGDWCVNPTSGQISRDEKTARIEARTMRLLLCLAEHAGEVVSIDELLNQVWPDVIVTPDSVYQAITSLRRLLGDDPKQPTYIATVPRLGYRMVASVSPWTEKPEPTSQLLQPDETAPSPPTPSTTTHAPSYGVRQGIRRQLHFTGSAFRWVAGAILGVVLLALVAVLIASLFHDRAAAADHPVTPPTRALQSQKSIAVLPFLDLTEGMKEGEFADGMTEELIDKLAKIPGLQVPAPTSSFYFKDKQLPVSEIARKLGVAYVLDGSVRKSGVRLRVAARLVRAESGFVVWSETYDRPLHDIIMVQDDIASAVTKALQTSINTNPH